MTFLEGLVAENIYETCIYTSGNARGACGLGADRTRNLYFLSGWQDQAGALPCGVDRANAQRFQSRADHPLRARPRTMPNALSHQGYFLESRPDAQRVGVAA